MPEESVTLSSSLPEVEVMKTLEDALTSLGQCSITKYPSPELRTGIEEYLVSVMISYESHLDTTSRRLTCEVERRLYGSI